MSSPEEVGADVLLEVRDLHVSYRASARLGAARAQPVRALAGVSLRLREGQTLALVGESGSGKTSIARAVLRLLPADAGQILWRTREGRTRDLAQLGQRELRGLRPQIGVVFQDPGASLDPRRRMAFQVGEALAWHTRARGAQLAQRVSELLGEVGLGADIGARYSHELSGGQRQRVALARALSLEPRLLVCDEIVSALDVSVQAQVLELLARLQRARGLALLFISHDLALVRHVADQVAVLYAGRLVECGPSAEVLQAPAHPYTRQLVAAIPGLVRRAGPAPELATPAPPSPTGCAFQGRCALVEARCALEVPPLRALGARSVACHVLEAEAGSARP